jgi:hypothetical protein
MQYTWTKDNYEAKSYEKVLVIVESKTNQGRINGENAIVSELQKAGITATNSSGVFPLNESNHELSEEEIENRIISGGYDGVLITSLIDAQSREVREGGTYYPQPVYARYGRYVRRGYVHMYEPEYYRQERIYVLETRLYDTSNRANKEAVVWSGQSELTDPNSAESAAKSYARTLVKTLLQKDIIVP